MKIQIEEADLRSVLEALEMWSVMTLKYMDARDKAITICKQTLEQTAQQQEPVAVYVGETWCGSVVRLYDDLPLETLFYTSPQPSKPWAGLTEEEVKHLWEVWRANSPRYVGFALGIETKLKEKNHG